MARTTYPIHQYSVKNVRNDNKTNPDAGPCFAGSLYRLTRKVGSFYQVLCGGTIVISLKNSQEKELWMHTLVAMPKARVPNSSGKNLWVRVNNEIFVMGLIKEAGIV